MRILFGLLVLVAVGAAGSADTLHSLGWLPEDPAKVAWLKEVKPDALGPLPRAVDHSANMPPVGSQGSSPSCTAWALGYYYKTYQEWLEHGWSVLDSAHRFSPAFLYNQASRGGTRGSYASDVMKVLVDQGCANLLDAPFRAPDHTTWPSETAYYHALPFRCREACWIDCRADPGLEALKQHLADGDNAVLGLYVWANFDNVNNFDTVYCVADQYGTNRGGHQVCIVGFNDERPTHDGPGAFRFVNSWGTGWGNRGYAWISYEAIKNSQLSGRWVCFTVDRRAYTPRVIARARLAHTQREWVKVTLGIGPADDPRWSHEFYDWELPAEAGHPFPAHDILFDLSDGAATLDDGDTNPIFLRAVDELADGISGEVQRVTSISNDWGAYGGVSTPAEIPDDGTPVVVNHRLPAQRLHWPGLGRFPAHGGQGLVRQATNSGGHWTYPAASGFSAGPCVGDCNEDGIPDVVIGSRGGTVYALEGRSGDTLWTSYVAASFGPAALGDVDADGRLEVVVGALDQRARALNAEDGSRLWSVAAGDGIETAPVLSDLDGDGRLEAVFGVYDGSVLALDGLTGGRRWATDIGGAASAPAVGDVDRDGRPEVVVGSADGGVSALGGADGIARWRFAAGGAVASAPALADIDGDSLPEVVFGADDGRIHALRGADGFPEWSYAAGGAVRAGPALGDIDGDGTIEVMAGALDGTLYVLNGIDGSPQWSYPTGGAIRSAPAHGDLDADGAPEVVFGSDDGRVYALAGSNGALRWFFTTGGAVSSAPALADVDDDGAVEVVLGSDDRNVYVLNGSATGQAERSREPVPAVATLAIWPNPVRGAGFIRYSLPRAGKVSLRLYDVAGGRVMTLVEGDRAAGAYSVGVPAANGLSAGVFLVRLETEQGSVATKLIRRR